MVSMVVPISGESMHKLSINNIKVLYDTIRHRDTGTAKMISLI